MRAAIWRVILLSQNILQCDHVSVLALRWLNIHVGCFLTPAIRFAHSKSVSLTSGFKVFWNIVIMLWNFWIRLDEFCGFDVVVVVYVSTGEWNAFLRELWTRTKGKYSDASDRSCSGAGQPAGTWTRAAGNSSRKSPSCCRVSISAGHKSSCMIEQPGHIYSTFFTTSRAAACISIFCGLSGRFHVQHFHLYQQGVFNCWNSQSANTVWQFHVGIV